MVKAVAKQNTNSEDVANLLSKGVITFKDYVEANPSATEADKAKAFITYSVGKTLPCAPEEVKNEVKEILRDVYENKNVTEMTGCLERRSLWSYEHSLRVAVITTAIGLKMGFSENDLAAAAEGAVVHDVGKIYFVDLIDKTGSLTNEEFEAIKNHTKAGYRILKDAGFSEDVAQVALLHHERSDGSGYWGVSDIPNTVMAVSIADSIDAMWAARPYKAEADIKDVISRLNVDVERKRYDIKMLDEVRKLMLP